MVNEREFETSKCYIEQTLLTDSDIKELKDKGVEIVKNHGRIYAQFIAPNGDVVKFRTMYQDPNGTISGKTPAGEDANFGEFNKDQIFALASGEPFEWEHTTTSGIPRKDIVILSSKVSKFGTMSYGPVPLSKMADDSLFVKQW